MTRTPPRTAPHGAFLKTEAGRQWAKDNIDRVTLHVHTTDPRPNAVCEFFTCDSLGSLGMLWTLERAIAECARLGIDVIPQLDIYFGNGRAESQSAVGKGRYHNSFEPGGSEGTSVKESITELIRWAKEHENVIGIGIINEPRESIPDKLYAKWAKHAKQEAPDDWAIIIGSGDEGDIHEAALWADELDVHLLRADWRDRLAVAVELAEQYHLPLNCSEMMPPKDVPDDVARMYVYHQMCEELKRCNYGPAVFVGNDKDYPRRADLKRRWNFKDIENFLAIDNEGETPMGVIFRSYFGEEQEPVDPPEPVPDPCEEKLQGVRGRCGRIADRLQEDLNYYDEHEEFKRLVLQVRREIPRLREIADG